MMCHLMSQIRSKKALFFFIFYMGRIWTLERLAGSNAFLAGHMQDTAGLACASGHEWTARI